MIFMVNENKKIKEPEYGRILTKERKSAWISTVVVNRKFKGKAKKEY